MIAALVSTCLAAVIWLTAISSDHWCGTTFDEWRPPKWRSTTNSSTNGTYVKSYNIGLWKICAYLYFNATNEFGT